MRSLSFRTDEKSAAEVRGAVAHIELIDPSFSREKLLRLGLELALLYLRKHHNDGMPFPGRENPLRSGQRRNRPL